LNFLRCCDIINILLKKGEKKMAYKISDECVACGSCADACPVGAISLEGNKYEINHDICIDCGTCHDTCPVSAIKEEE
jgi:formate hydrogenlyase subunit 6/NADH:ubiquinone oxidoreductase subunit I